MVSRATSRSEREEVVDQVGHGKGGVERDSISLGPTLGKQNFENGQVAKLEKRNELEQDGTAICFWWFGHER